MLLLLLLLLLMVLLLLLGLLSVKVQLILQHLRQHLIGLLLLLPALPLLPVPLPDQLQLTQPVQHILLKCCTTSAIRINSLPLLLLPLLLGTGRRWL
jgi:hypothetical protein